MVDEAKVEQVTASVGSAVQALAVATNGLEPESALSIRGAFETMFAQAEEWTKRAAEIRVTDVTQKREMKLARESRLALREIRVQAEHTRKRLKEDSTRKGRAIDGVANVIKALIEPIEEHLLEQEQFAERVEAARKATLGATRAESLRAYGADPTVYAALGEVSDEAWVTIADAARMAHQARQEAARQAEAVRVEAERITAERAAAERAAAVKAEAERADRERVQAEENARLKAEAHEREAAAARELAAVKAEAERVQIEAQERELAAKAAEARAAAALAAEQERQRAAAAAEENARQAAATAPDRDKLAALAAQVRALALPAMGTPRGQEAGDKVAAQLRRMADWIDTTGAAL